MALGRKTEKNTLAINDIVAFFLQITTLLDTMMKEVGDVKEVAEEISGLKRKLEEVFYQFKPLVEAQQLKLIIVIIF